MEIQINCKNGFNCVCDKKTTTRLKIITKNSQKILKKSYDNKTKKILKFEWKFFEPKKMYQAQQCQKFYLQNLIHPHF